MHAQGLAPDMMPRRPKPGLLAKIGLDQKIGQTLPLDLPFTDEAGQAVTLGQYFGGSGRSFWRWSITSARCSAPRC